jgi:hypothetical protein
LPRGTPGDDYGKPLLGLWGAFMNNPG